MPARRQCSAATREYTQPTLRRIGSSERLNITPLEGLPSNVSGTPTLGLYQPRALCAVAPHLLPGLRCEEDVWRGFRAPPRDVGARSSRREVGYCSILYRVNIGAARN
eukprot:scaffold53394_cov42-Phaeocystis_antarctica.AAC.1